MASVEGANGNTNAAAGDAATGAGPKVGSKLECPSCGAVIVVVKAPDRPLSCCGSPLGATSAEEASRG